MLEPLKTLILTVPNTSIETILVLPVEKKALTLGRRSGKIQAARLGIEPTALNNPLLKEEWIIQSSGGCGVIAQRSEHWCALPEALGSIPSRAA